MLVPEILLQVGTSACLGALIGLEREYRAKMAGLRTNTLVAVGAALFTLLSSHSFAPGAHQTDPTRIAAQIVSGIGFLGAGVILRDGLNVRGLDTAATLWCTAAVGALAGAGDYPVATTGTVCVLATNILLRSTTLPQDQHEHTRDEARATRHIRARSSQSPPDQPAPPPRNTGDPPPAGADPSNTTMHGDIHINKADRFRATPPSEHHRMRFPNTAFLVVFVGAMATLNVLTDLNQLFFLNAHSSSISSAPLQSVDSFPIGAAARLVDQCETQHHLTQQTQKIAVSDETTEFASCQWPAPQYADTDGFTDITATTAHPSGNSLGDTLVDRIRGPCHTFLLTYNSREQRPPITMHPGQIATLTQQQTNWPPADTLDFFPDRNEVDVLHHADTTLSNDSCQD